MFYGLDVHKEFLQVCALAEDGLRDVAWQKMADMNPEDEIPFDGKRMIFGGFKPLVVLE